MRLKYIFISIVFHIFVIVLIIIYKPKRIEINFIQEPIIMNIEVFKEKTIVKQKQEEGKENTEKIEGKPKEVQKKAKEEKVKEQKKELAIKKKYKKLKQEKEKKEEVKKEKKAEKKENKNSKVIQTEQEFSYNYYLNIIQARIYKNFVVPYKIDVEDNIVIIYFEIQKNGQITNIKFEKKSKSELLNRLAYRAVKITRLPPLPSAYVNQGNSFLAVHFTFIYEAKE